MNKNEFLMQILFHISAVAQRMLLQRAAVAALLNTLSADNASTRFSPVCFTQKEKGQGMVTGQH